MGPSLPGLRHGASPNGAPKATPKAPLNGTQALANADEKENGRKENGRKEKGGKEKGPDIADPLGSSAFKMKRTGLPGALQPLSKKPPEPSEKTRELIDLVDSNSDSEGDEAEDDESEGSESEDSESGDEPSDDEPIVIASDIVQPTSPIPPTPQRQPKLPRWEREAIEACGPDWENNPLYADIVAHRRRNLELKSQRMKERWASGSMDHVHEKRMETLKRRRSEMAQGQPSAKKRVVPARHSEAALPPAAPSPSPSAGLPPTDGTKLWNYMRPHLKTYNRPEMTGGSFVPDMITLPRARDLRWKQPWSFSHKYAAVRPSDVAAMAVYLTGVAAPEPCNRCSKGSGPFDGCVLVSPSAPRAARLALASCSNCLYYRSGEVPCSHKARAAEEPEVHSQAKKPAQPAKEQPKESDKNGASVPSEHDEIEKTPSGRPYSMWPDESGELITTHGALVPDGYQPLTRNPRWVCAIDTCERALLNIRSFGFHFSRAHYGCLLNDNGDGTLTIVGRYGTKDVVGGGRVVSDSPTWPRVVSRKPKAELDLSAVTQEAQPAVSLQLAPQPEPTATTAEGDAKAMWEYIRPHLARTTAIPDNGWVKELLPLTRRRPLRWNPRRLADFKEHIPRDVSCMIVQLTGDVAPDPCTRCRLGKGPFDGCVAVSTEAPAEVRSRFVSCANCNYHNGQTMCDIRSWILARQQSPFPGYKGRGGHASPGVPSLDEQHPLVGMTRRRSERHLFSQTPARQRGGSAVARQLRRRPDILGPLVQQAPQQASQSALVSAGEVQPAPDSLEMEEWEIAPGRIVAEASETPDNVAVSNAYLSTNQSVQICNELSFRVEVVRPGATLRFEADDKTRVCSLAAGKLRVRVDGEPEFAIGPHGLFKVRPAVAVSAQNRLYVDAIVHVSELAEM